MEELGIPSIEDATANAAHGARRSESERKGHRPSRPPGQTEYVVGRKQLGPDFAAAGESR
ncbi:unnamed protein product [Diplocarpon coronariae]